MKLTLPKNALFNGSQTFDASWVRDEADQAQVALWPLDGPNAGSPPGGTFAVSPVRWDAGDDAINADVLAGLQKFGPPVYPGFDQFAIVA